MGNSPLQSYREESYSNRLPKTQYSYNIYKFGKAIWPHLDHLDHLSRGNTEGLLYVVPMRPISVEGFVGREEGHKGRIYLYQVMQSSSMYSIHARTSAAGSGTSSDAICPPQDQLLKSSIKASRVETRDSNISSKSTHKRKCRVMESPQRLARLHEKENGEKECRYHRDDTTEE